VTTVGQALVAGLAARGVRVVFGIPGVHTVELYRGLAGSSIRHVTVRHEQGAAFAADGYARATGQPGVALVITGPGLTNALTAMAQSRADSVPVLVISGVNRRDSLGKGLGLLHELPDQAGMVRSLCPTFQVTGPDDLGPVLDAAFAALTTGRPGPVHVEVPTDVMGMPCALPMLGVLPVRPMPDAALVAAAKARLTAARRPVVLAGGGCVRADAELTALAEALDAPVVLTSNARGLLAGHPLAVPASPSLQAVRALIADADVVLAIGTELGPTDYDMYVRGGLPDLSTMIRIDVCADQLTKHPASIALQGDASMVLPLLVCTHRKADGVARAAAATAAAFAELSPAMQHQARLLAVMADALPDAIIVGDSTQPVYAGNLFHHAPFPGAWFNAATGYGALGFAPGAAMGAAIGSHRPVICLIGDGGLQFSPGELRTAVDEALPITYVVWNNAGFREIAEAMADAGTDVIGCTPSPLRMGPFAAACDLPFTSILPDAGALRAALLAPYAGPRMIEIRVT
jgi:acetolactate synthase I/II/III large subunit